MIKSKTILTSILVTSFLVVAGCTTQTATNTNAVTNTIVNSNAVNQNSNTEVVTNTNETIVSDNTNTESVSDGNTEQRSEVDLPSEALAQEDTSDWLTYTNEEYGFSLRYPRNWKITEMNKWDCVELISPELVAYNKEWTKKNIEAAQIDTDAVQTYDINICRKENSSNLSLDDWIQKNVESAWIISKSNIRLNNLDSIEIITDVLGVWKQTFVAVDKNIIRVSRLKKPVAIDSDVVEEIISTVEFIQ